MEREEQIKQMIGKRTPFKVPDGYFEQFNERIMAGLPVVDGRVSKRVHVGLWQRVQPWIYLAACFAAVTWSVNFWTGGKEQFSSAMVAVEFEDEHEEDMDAVYLASSNEYVMYEAFFASDNGGN